MADLPSNPSSYFLIGIPKGTLEDSVLAILKAGGLEISFPRRSLCYAAPSLPNAVFLRLKPPDIPRLIASGDLSCGIAGYDQVLEQGYLGGALLKAADFKSSKSLGRSVAWTVAVKAGISYADIREIATSRREAGLPPLKVATELPNVVVRWFEDHGIPVTVIRTTGSTEALLPWIADVIVDLVDSGDSLRQNGLQGLDVVLRSTACLWIRPDSNPSMVQRLQVHIEHGVEALLGEA
jgi:ATP phosphoribosyltransferase